MFNSVNRLAGRTIYTIEVATNTDRHTVEGEGVVLTFVARNHFKQVEGHFDMSRMRNFEDFCRA